VSEISDYNKWGELQWTIYRYPGILQNGLAWFC